MTIQNEILLNKFAAYAIQVRRIIQKKETYYPPMAKC